MLMDINVDDLKKKLTKQGELVLHDSPIPNSRVYEEKVKKQLTIHKYGG